MALSLSSLISPFAPRKVSLEAIKFERARWLRPCAELFSLKPTQVYQISEDKRGLVVSAQIAHLPTKKEIVLKALAIATLILPLLAALGAVIYSKLNPICAVVYTKLDPVCLDKCEVDAQDLLSSIEKAYQIVDTVTLRKLLDSPELSKIALHDLLEFSNKMVKLENTEKAVAYIMLREKCLEMRAGAEGRVPSIKDVDSNFFALTFKARGHTYNLISPAKIKEAMEKARMFINGFGFKRQDLFREVINCAKQRRLVFTQGEKLALEILAETLRCDIENPEYARSQGVSEWEDIEDTRACYSQLVEFLQTL